MRVLVPLFPPSPCPCNGRQPSFAVSIALDATSGKESNSIPLEVARPAVYERYAFTSISLPLRAPRLILDKNETDNALTNFTKRWFWRRRQRPSRSRRETCRFRRATRRVYAKCTFRSHYYRITSG